MKQQKLELLWQEYGSSAELVAADAQLLEQARAVTGQAYAPYSRFHVGAVARLTTGVLVVGTNQENASYPVGICAERVLLGTVANQHPGVAVESIAISYDSERHKSDHPISPCGMCRQALVEFEARMQQPVRLILGGRNGPVYVFERAGYLLPLAFAPHELK
jgi:cytidine deaminase